jgi:hypothetical protein
MKNNKNIFYQELIGKQRKNLVGTKKLTLLDLKRIASYITTSLFINECSLWCGYITQFKDNSPYINFFFNGKKQALHRLLYYNFIDDINDSEYLKFNCNNKGKCCCINHIVKIKNNNEQHTIEPSIIIQNNDKVKKDITVSF